MTLVPLVGASIVAWLALVTIGPAWADCMTRCMAGKPPCGLQYESSRVEPGYCSLAQSDCEVWCSRLEGAGESWGAIAFSPSTGAWGDSARYGSRAVAELRALAGCAKQARDCTVAVWFTHQCGAVASGKAGIWAGGLGRTQPAASSDAIADCLKRGGKTCETQHTVCSR